MTITLRNTKGTALTFSELDGNFTDLNTRVTTNTTDIAAHLADTVDAHDASAISNVAAGTISSTDVQSAINELDGDRVQNTTDIATNAAAIAAHIADTTDAHAASAITNTPAGNIAATTVQVAINELDTEKVAKAGDTMTGNLTFSGNSLMIKGDLSNATIANRLMFQTSTSNSSSTVGVIPSGTGNIGRFTAYGGSDANNTSFASISISEADQLAKIVSDASGTGTRRSLSVEVGGAEVARWITTGQLGLGGAPVDSNGRIQTFQTGSGSAVAGARFVNTSNTASSAVIVSLDPGNNGITARDAQIRAVTDGANIIDMQFFTANAATPTEKARITGAGEILFATTTPLSFGSTTAQGFDYVGASFQARLSRSANPCAQFQRTGSDGELIQFYRTNTQVGNISVTGSATAYNTSSDYRLKDDIQDIGESGGFIDALRPRIWRWKNTGEVGCGFIAHELQEVSPSSVTGEKDAIDEEGNPAYQAVEYGSAEVIAMLIAEVQALRKRVAQLEVVQ